MVADPTLPSQGFLASLHPGGDPSTILLIDRPAYPETSDEVGDVIMLVMTDIQCRDADQTDAMIGRALSALAPDGILWMGAPGRWHSALKSALSTKGMHIGATFAHRGRGVARTEFALTPGALRLAVRSGQMSRRWGLALRLLESVPGGSIPLVRLLRRTGFIAFRPGVTPFGWLIDRVAGADDVEVVIKTGWRGEGAPFLVFALADGETVVAKRGNPESHASSAHEAEILTQLGAGAARAGLEVPRPIDLSSTPRLCTLIETAVPGRPMAGLIRDGHHRDIGAIADCLSAWLCRWNSQTVRHVELTEALSESLILAPARELVGSIGRGNAYLDWLLRETGKLIGRKVPLVAAHNDLTMVNLLGDRSGVRSVVDWEAASRDGLPLADFRYAVCNAATAVRGGDRLAAYRACFLDESELRERLKQCEAPLREATGGPSEWLELSAHAAWLRHAANEQARASSRPDAAFIAIANALARSVADR